MDKLTPSLVAAALVSVIGALASHGAGAIAALAGVPALLQAWAAGLPLGVWSSALALALATLAWVYAIRYLPVGKTGKAPFGYANVIALLVGLAVTVAQYRVAPVQTPGGLLNAVFLGLIAGGVAPQFGTLLRGRARTAP